MRYQKNSADEINPCFVSTQALRRRDRICNLRLWVVRVPASTISRSDGVLLPSSLRAALCAVVSAYSPSSFCSSIDGTGLARGFHGRIFGGSVNERPFFTWSCRRMHRCVWIGSVRRDLRPTPVFSDIFRDWRYRGLAQRIFIRAVGGIVHCKRKTSRPCRIGENAVHRICHLASCRGYLSLFA